MTTGREIKVHEYAKRDTSYPEDMGLGTTEWSIDAYVIGDDYMSRRDDLVALCKRLGAKRYTDLWGGGMSARVVIPKGGCQVRESSQEGRLARFQIKLIDAGGTSGPSAVAATAAQLAGASVLLSKAAVLSFATSGIVGQSLPGLATAIGSTVSALPAAVKSRVAGSVKGL